MLERGYDCLREKKGREQADPEPERDPQSKTRGGHEERERLLCAVCGYPITTRDAAIAVAEKHLHTFFNPAGVLYEIGCFREADGCITVGEPTTDFSWFPGYGWLYTACARCTSHLGWRFESVNGPHGFHGLILKRLVMESE